MESEDILSWEGHTRIIKSSSRVNDPHRDVTPNPGSISTKLQPAELISGSTSGKLDSWFFSWSRAQTWLLSLLSQEKEVVLQVRKLIKRLFCLPWILHQSQWTGRAFPVGVWVCISPLLSKSLQPSLHSITKLFLQPLTSLPVLSLEILFLSPDHLSQQGWNVAVQVRKWCMVEGKEL